MKTILVVEDESLHREAICSNLEDAGFLSEQAEDGKQAFDLLGTRNIDLVLTDNKMPVMSGLELIREVRAQPAFDRIPIILFTGIPDPSMLAIAEKIGVYRTFFKPLIFEELLLVVQSALSLPDPQVSGNDHRVSDGE